jgi:hypothetical protein
MFQPRQMVMWQKTELIIQQSVLLCDLTILFNSQTSAPSQAGSPLAFVET